MNATSPGSVNSVQTWSMASELPPVPMHSSSDTPIPSRASIRSRIQPRSGHAPSGAP